MITLIRTPAHWHLHVRGLGGIFIVLGPTYGFGINILRGRNIGTRWVLLQGKRVKLIGWRR